MAELKQGPVRILIIDDDEDDFYITSEYLREIQEYQLKVDWCYRYNDAIGFVKSAAYDMYFVDYRLGAKTGIDFLKDAVAAGCEEPIVLLTGKGNKTVDIQAMQMGATDYLIKTDLSIDKLERCIRYALERTAYVKALRANERKYRSIFELSKDAVFIADRDLRLRDMNQATSDPLGYDAEGLRNLSLFELVPDEVERRTLQLALLRDGEVNDMELEFQTNGGERRSCIFSAVTTAEGTPEAQYQGLIHDITNLKKAEKANILVEKLAATGRLVRTLAHEVRNPLNNINMSVEQLGHGMEVEEAPLYLDIIQRNSKRIGDLITELLDSARPTELTFERCILQTVMDDSIADAMDRITLQRTNMQIRYCDEPCFVMGNIEKLKIAFLNIIINAVEAMEVNEGELEIVIETTGATHKVTIRDNGSGIPEENLSRLFEPYFTSKRNGMGLGLAATLNILQAHKAHIDVSSVVGEGTVFVITFPGI